MRLLKYIFYIISSLVLVSGSTACSYVSDTVEGLITDRASFSATAEYDGSGVIIRWDETDDSDDFAGYEIYRTSDPNDEFTSYILVASRHYTVHKISGDLESGSTTSCKVDAPITPGIYFYRVGIIHIESDDYDIPYDASNLSYYNLYTEIDAISGYARVVIP